MRAECLAYAVEADEEFGIWDGLNRAERVRVRHAHVAPVEPSGTGRPGKGHSAA